MTALKEELIDYAHGIGIDLIGVTTPEPFQRLVDEVESRRDHYAERYAHRTAAWTKLANPRSVLPEARSVVVIGFYYLAEDPPAEGPHGTLGRIVSHGHLGILKRARALRKFLRDWGFEAVMGIHRKEAAVRAGLGAIGKNDLVLNPEFGAWVAYQALVTDAPLEPDAPFTGDPCGNCDLCLKACPTGALYEPHRLDPRRCLTCLLTGSQIPPEYWPAVGTRIMGCDACLEACPRNKGIHPRHQLDSALPDGLGRHLPLHHLLALTERSFHEEILANVLRQFTGGRVLARLMRHPRAWRLALHILKAAGRDKEILPDSFMHAGERLVAFKRNGLIAAGNLADPSLREDVDRCLADPQLAPYARWAAERIDNHE